MKVVSLSQHLEQSLGSLRPAASLVLSPGSPGLAAVWSGLGLEGTDRLLHSVTPHVSSP